jgi:hypothetical protein
VAFTLYQKLLDSKIRKGKLDEALTKIAVLTNGCNIFTSKKCRNCLGEKGVDGIIILKCLIKK